MPEPLSPIPTIDNLAERKTWFESGDGMPVQPEGYADLASDDPKKVAYDNSVTTNTAQIAEIQALIDAG